MKRIPTLLLALQLGLLAPSAQFKTDPVVVWPLAYQGTLSSHGVAVNAPHDIILSLWAGPVGGTQIGASITNETVDVNNGQFRLTIEGRDGWSTGDLSATNLYLQAALRPSGSGAPFVTLSPRPRLASVPRAGVADKAMSISLDALAPSVLGTNGVDGQLLALGSVTGNQIGSSQVVKSINGLQDSVMLVGEGGISISNSGNGMLRIYQASLQGGSCSDYDNCYWTLIGNGLTTAPLPQTAVPLATDNWLGTTDGQALELRVRNYRGLRLEPDLTGIAGGKTVNFIGGFWDNFVDAGVWSATIGGGGSLASGANRVRGSYGVVAGGAANVAGGGINNGSYATVGGGFSNLASGYVSTIAGGSRNSATFDFTTVSGGASNVAEVAYAMVGGGLRNTNSAYAGSIGGGDTNWIRGGSDSSAIGGGQANLIEPLAPFATISGGRVNNVSATDATIGGGAFNTNAGFSSTISGGDFNVIPSGAGFTTVAGGRLNDASGPGSAIGGGQRNRTTAAGNMATVGGGFNNSAEAVLSTIAGGGQHIARGAASTIGGGEGNKAFADDSTVSGGRGHYATGDASTVGGGAFNDAKTAYSTIPGGLRALTGSYGQQAYASGQFASPGDAQSSLFVLRANTTTGTPAELFLDDGTAFQRMIVPNNTTWSFHILIVARSNLGSVPSDVSDGWEIKGIIQNINNWVSECSSVVRICDIHPVPLPNPSILALNAGSIHALAINVNGVAGSNIRWVASVRTAEVTNP